MTRALTPWFPEKQTLSDRCAWRFSGHLWRLGVGHGLHAELLGTPLEAEQHSLAVAFLGPTAPQIA